MAKRGKVRKLTEVRKTKPKFSIAGIIILIIGIIWIIASLTEYILHWAVGILVLMIGIWILIRHYYKGR